MILTRRIKQIWRHPTLSSQIFMLCIVFWMLNLCLLIWTGYLPYLLLHDPSSDYAAYYNKKISCCGNNKIVQTQNVTKPDNCPTGRTLYIEGIRGRLGNHMFQYAAAYGIARKTDSKVVMSVKHQLPKYFKGLKFPFEDIDGETSSMWSVREMQPSIYDHRLIENLPAVSHVHLCCYLESYKYFVGYEEEIRAEFQFADDIENQALQFISHVRSEAERDFQSKNVTLVGIHVRRGDKALIQTFGWNVPGPSYFIKAMNYMRKKYKNVHFVLTSEDYSWCSKNIGQKYISYSTSSTSPGQDLAYLSKCDHMIMSVGTLGWWAGWLAGGTVIYFDKPKRNGTKADEICNLQDLFPQRKNWIKMSD